MLSTYMSGPEHWPSYILETEHLEKSFNTNLAALLWTISSLEILCSVDWAHTGEAIQEQILPLTYNIFP